MPKEYPDQTYYPSAKVSLYVRLEEFAGDEVKKAVPAKSSLRLKGIKDERDGLRVIPDPETGAGRRFLIVSGGAPPTRGGGDKQTASPDNLSFPIYGVIPSKATWKLNSIRTADTLSLTIRYADLPIDPRCIRACAVEFFLGTVSPADFAAGIAGTRRAGADKEALHLVPDTFRDSQGRSRSNRRFVGWVDKYKLTAGGEGEALLELECVDNTRLLEKQPAPPKLVVGMKKPIDEAVAEYMSHFPQMEGLSVQYLPRDTPADEIPKLETTLAHTSFVPNLGPPASGGGGGASSSSSVLDYLTSVVGSVAHSIRFDGTTLIIQRASNTFGSDGAANRSDDPFQGRNLPSGRFPVRAFIYGRNVLEYSIERDLAKKEAKNVEVRSYDPHRKNVNVARFPEKEDRVANAGPGAGKADANWIVHRLPDGIRDKKVLKETAEEVFFANNRQELTVAVKTRNLASFGGGNEDPDLLDMNYGDAFELLQDGNEGEGSEAARERELRSPSLSASMLEALGFDSAFATAYAKAYGNAGFQRQYMLKEMAVEWDANEGVSFEIVGVNFIAARVSAPGTAGGKK